MSESIGKKLNTYEKLILDYFIENGNTFQYTQQLFKDTGQKRPTLIKYRKSLLDTQLLTKRHMMSRDGKKEVVGYKINPNMPLDSFLTIANEYLGSEKELAFVSCPAIQQCINQHMIGFAEEKYNLDLKTVDVILLKIFRSSPSALSICIHHQLPESILNNGKKKRWNYVMNGFCRALAFDIFKYHGDNRLLNELEVIVDVSMPE